MAENLRIKVTALLSFPYVCIGSHAFAMFAHKKKITGARGTLTTLYQILYMDTCLHFMGIQLDYVVDSGPFFSA